MPGFKEWLMGEAEYPETNGNKVAQAVSGPFAVFGWRSTMTLLLALIALLQWIANGSLSKLDKVSDKLNDLTIEVVKLGGDIKAANLVNANHEIRLNKLEDDRRRVP